MIKRKFSCKISNLNQNKKFGKIFSSFLKPGSIVCLEGEMGVGKTETARSIISALCCEVLNVSSPSYNLMFSYKTINGENLNHYDFYRLNSYHEAINLNILENFYHSINIIEWPEKINELLPKDYISILLLFDQKKENSRKIIVSGKKEIISQLQKKYEITF